MDTTWVVQWSYRDQQLVYPTGVVAGDSGRIYICSWNSHTIYVLSTDGVHLAVIPQSHTGIQYLHAVCCIRFHRTLYVSMYNCDPEHWNYIRRPRLQWHKGKQQVTKYLKSNGEYFKSIVCESWYRNPAVATPSIILYVNLSPRSFVYNALQDVNLFVFICVCDSW